nr:MAG TPA: hypothetical protein [Caudoviricetes sp.]
MWCRVDMCAIFPVLLRYGCNLSKCRVCYEI